MLLTQSCGFSTQRGTSYPLVKGECIGILKRYKWSVLELHLPGASANECPKESSHSRFITLWLLAREGVCRKSREWRMLNSFLTSLPDFPTR